MKWIWYEYEVDPSLNFVMVDGGVICTQIGAPGQHMAVMYYGEIMNLVYAYSQQ